MEILIISVVAFFAAILTFFSGFGLGTILTPVMMIFFPVEIAVAFTGIVHFSNNNTCRADFSVDLYGARTI